MARMGMNMGRRRGREEELGGWVHRDLELAAGRSAPQGGLCIFGSPLTCCGHSVAQTPKPYRKGAMVSA